MKRRPYDIERTKDAYKRHLKMIRLWLGGYSYVELGEMFGVSKQRIYGIIMKIRYEINLSHAKKGDAHLIPAATKNMKEYIKKLEREV